MTSVSGGNNNRCRLDLFTLARVATTIEHSSHYGSDGGEAATRRVDISSCPKHIGKCRAEESGVDGEAEVMLEAVEDVDYLLLL